MLYKPKVVDLNLEQVLVTGLFDDHGGMAPPLFLERGNSSGGTATPRTVHRPPMSSARVLMVKVLCLVLVISDNA
jgi:hypothetical protein